jgi:phosphotransferase system IIA component
LAIERNREGSGNGTQVKENREGEGNCFSALGKKRKKWEKGDGVVRCVLTQIKEEKKKTVAPVSSGKEKEKKRKWRNDVTGPQGERGEEEREKEKK